MHRKRAQRATAAVALAALLLPVTGCSFGGKPAPPIRYYKLDYPPPPAASRTTPVVVQVLPLQTAADYDRNAIVARDSQHEVERYYYSRWSSAPARMVGDLIQRDLADSGAFEAVVQGATPVRADYTLSGIIETIEQTAAGGCSARLRARFTLADNATSATPVLFQRVFEQVEPCGGDEVDDVVAAMSRALARLSAELRDAMIAAISENPR